MKSVSSEEEEAVLVLLVSLLALLAAELPASSVEELLPSMAPAPWMGQTALGSKLSTLNLVASEPDLALVALDLVASDLVASVPDLALVP